MAKNNLLPGVLFVCVLALLCNPLFAQDVYRGKTITLIASHPPGGLYDAHARVLARHLGKHIPGKPSYVVQNMPGAGGVIAANHLYSVAKRDGSTIALAFRPVALHQLLRENKAEKVPYDSRRFGWIGSMGQEISACIARRDTNFKSIKDLIGASRPLIVGGSGPGADSVDFPRLLIATLGTKLKLISGFPGAAPIYTAIERGELESYCATWSAIKALRPEWFRDGFVNVLAYMSIDRNSELDKMGAPWIFDLVKDEQSRLLWETRLIPNVMAWPVITPPEVPTERVSQLRKAFMATMKDAAYLSEAKKMMLDIDPVSGEEVEKVVQRLFAVPKDLLQELTKILD